MPDAEKTPLPPLTLGGSLWTITEEALRRLVQAERGGDFPTWASLAERFAASPSRAASRRSTGTRAGGAVAILALTGVLTPRGSFLAYLFGGASGGLQGFRETFRDALADPDIGAIVIDIDSPGGLVDLTPETAEEIRAARGDKPIVAVANTLAASGAYWIGAQADELIVTPSGNVGSIGVYRVHEDWSGWNDQRGIDPTYISAGRFKTEGNMDEPLSEEGREAWQEHVNEIYEMFAEAVAAGRDVTADTVRSDYGEGRVLTATQALASGMVDRVATLESVVRELLTPGSAGSSARAASRVIAPAAETEPPPAAVEEPPAPAPAPAPAAEAEAEPASTEPDDAEARAAVADLLI